MTAAVGCRSGGGKKFPAPKQCVRHGRALSCEMARRVRARLFSFSGFYAQRRQLHDSQPSG